MAVDDAVVVCGDGDLGGDVLSVFIIVVDIIVV